MNTQILISDVLQEFPSVYPQSFIVRPVIPTSPLIKKIKEKLPLKVKFNKESFSLYQLFWLTYELLLPFVDWSNNHIFIVDLEWQKILGCKIFTRQHLKYLLAKHLTWANRTIYNQAFFGIQLAYVRTGLIGLRRWSLDEFFKSEKARELCRQKTQFGDIYCLPFSFLQLLPICKLCCSKFSCKHYQGTATALFRLFLDFIREHQICYLDQDNLEILICKSNKLQKVFHCNYLSLDQFPENFFETLTPWGWDQLNLETTDLLLPPPTVGLFQAYRLF
jgi:hypothetical protein